jgi:hypothetical protein
MIGEEGWEEKGWGGMEMKGREGRMGGEGKGREGNYTGSLLLFSP